MCGNRTTNVTNTGLGDEQFKQLQTNQTGLGNQIQEGFTAAGTKLDSVDRNVSGLGTKIDNAGAVINENTNTGFTNLSGLLEAYGDTLTQGQSDAASGRKQYYDNMLTALQNNTGGLQTSLDTGFQEVGGRFDAVDQANTDIQTSVDTGFDDQATAFNTLEAGMNAQFDTQNTGLTDAFTSLGGDLDTAFSTASDDLQNVSSNVLQGQGELGQSLDTLSSNQDTYYGDLASRGTNLQETTDGFQTNFDNFVNRYTDDTTLANQARADISTGQANATSALREDLGAYADATAKGQGNLAARIGSLGEGTAAGFEVLSGAVEGGFSDASTSAQVERQNLANRIGNVKTLLENTGENLDASTRQQYSALAASFDENGNLISNAIDAQGNTITRALDEQGNIIQTTFDGTGTEIGKVAMDVETMLNNADAYQNSLSNQLQGIMATSTDTQRVAQDTAQQVQAGFDDTSQTMDVQLRDLARIASGQTDIDMRMRQDFRQIGDSFDDQGRLITNSVSQNGTTISRAIDENGNLLLRAFDVQGNRIGDKVLNINKSLFELQNLQQVAGANVSMGELSPAMQGEVPSGGFASPFTTTR
jgi:hypothetical protein